MKKIIFSIFFLLFSIATIGQNIINIDSLIFESQKKLGKLYLKTIETNKKNEYVFNFLYIPNENHSIEFSKIVYNENKKVKIKGLKINKDKFVRKYNEYSFSIKTNEQPDYINFNQFVCRVGVNWYSEYVYRDHLILSLSENKLPSNLNDAIVLNYKGLIHYDIPDNNEENSSNLQILDVDINIPSIDKKNSNRFALIIGNENYKKNGGLQADVTFAINDAQTFKKYAINTLGIPETNIKYLEDATATQMKKQIDLFIALMEISPEKREFYIYYAGHGYPDNNKDAYLMPVDVSADYLGDAIKLSELYQKLIAKSPKRVTIFLDACFSGGGRTGDDLISARSGVRIKPNETALTGNLVIFAASSEDQVSKPYTDKQHGMFSYFLFKTLQEYNGKITYGQLADELVEKVSTYSININNSI